jgi:hypothetical protein
VRRFLISVSWPVLHTKPFNLTGLKSLGCLIVLIQAWMTGLVLDLGQAKKPSPHSWAELLMPKAAFGKARTCQKKNAIFRSLKLFWQTRLKKNLKPCISTFCSVF